MAVPSERCAYHLNLDLERPPTTNNGGVPDAHNGPSLSTLSTTLMHSAAHHAHTLKNVYCML